MLMKYTMQYYRILIIWICMITSTTHAADNAMPSTRLLPNLLGGPPQDSELLPKVFDFLQNYMTHNPDTIQPLGGLLGEQNNSVIKELLKPLDDVITGNASFRDALKEILNSPVVRQLMNIGDMMTAGYLEGQGVSRSCYNDLKLSGSGIISGKDWALRMLDAFGKPGSGLMDYQVKWYGSYDECIAVKALDQYNTSEGKVTTQEHFAGKYCRVYIKAGQQSTALGAGSAQASITMGTCVPDSCSTTDLTEILKAATVLVTQNVTADGPRVTCEEKEDFDAGAVVAICILGVIAMLIVLGTLYDVIVIQVKRRPANLQNKPLDTKAPSVKGVGNKGYPADTEMSNSALEIESSLGNEGAVLSKADEVKEHDLHLGVKLDKETTNEQISSGVLEKILLSFSAYSNGVKILSTHQSVGSLSAVNGIRFLSMAWVILGHTYEVELAGAENLATFASQQINTVPFMGVLYAEVSVDTFFVLSGLLVAYLTLKEIEKAGGVRRFNWLMFYFHRFWRLTPVYMLVYMIWTTLTIHLYNGPMWSQGHLIYGYCKEVWWSSLLYINNFVNFEKPDVIIYQLIIFFANFQCMGWTWYLANDMQFYVLSPLLLIPLFYKAVVGGMVSFLFLVGTTVSTALIVMNHHYPVQKGSYAPKPLDSNYGKYVYDPCYTRMGPYIVGLVTGYLLYKMKCKCQMPKVCVLLGWFVCFGICISVVYGPYTDKDSHIFSLEESIVYMSLHRTGWGIAVAWIVFACATGYGGWINELLSWKAFIPLARLTYCAYLVHPIVQIVHMLGRRLPSYLNNYEIIYLFLAHIVLSYGVAYIVSIAFESPMMGIEKAIFKRERKS